MEKNLNTYLKTLISILIILAFMIKSSPVSSGFPTMITGAASWYAEFSPGIKLTTANMETFDHDKLTCAIWDMPFNTVLLVTNNENGKTVKVRVNDRGPAKKLCREGRVIDLTKGAFEKLADLDKGLIDVKVEVLK
ncbi:MAG: septal ring lytic transglycosylase RlpA family lipoprotein [Candidatus Omnitrophica bacterium]|nr:septal ring lytic transglycosylase RlpA family lipoprotein [Candidatus Omnitrophota bacterium]